MRTFVKWAAAPTLILMVVTVAALSGRGDSAPLSADLASDLELVTTASELELAPLGTGASVVSAAEQIERPAPRRTPTPSRNRGTKAPPPQVVAVSDAGEEGVEVAETVVPAAATDDAELMIPSPEPSAPPAVPRPRPVEPRFPVGTDSRVGAGDRGAGGGIGTIVIRGGRTGRDDCAIHDRRRGGALGPVIHIAINQRMPGGVSFPGVPTFPRR